MPARCVHELFEAHAERTPDAPAVRYGHSELSYGDLNQRANGLARRLIESGVGPEVLVGVCLDRSFDLVVALLAVLKAGGAYVPLDPAYPRDRLEFMLADSAASVLVTSHGLAPRSAAKVITLDDPRLMRGSDARVDGGAGPSNAAYVIYTSGSTGWPKGVVLEHDALCRYAAVATQITPGSRRLFSAAIGFSASVRQLLLPLTYGRNVIVASEEDRTDVRRTLNLLRSEGISVWDTTPSLLDTALSLAEDPQAAFGRLETILVTGEPLMPSTARRLDEVTDGRVHLVNLYSQTETVGTVTSHVVGREDSASVPAGRPLADARVLILGADMEPTEEGEVWISSRRLARGYLGDAALTADAFRVGPGGERMYRTGDIGRMRADGSFELLGRSDRRVNIAGMRVELDEVESTLRGDHDVARAAVVFNEGRLNAAVVPAHGRAVTARELQARLARWLPRHMVPAELAVVDDLPLLPSGKLDLTAIAAIRGERSLLAEYVPPETPGEMLIASVFEQLLGKPGVGADDDFFARGGDSLLATRMLARLRQQTGRQLSLRCVFEAPTPRGLALRLEAAPAVAESTIRPTESRRMSFAQERLWLVEELGVRSGVYNVARALRLSGVLDVAALERALRAIVARHDVLRARFALVDGVPEMIVGDGSDFALRISEDAESGAEVRRPFQLDKGGLFRALLVRKAPDEHVLVLTVHHIVCDGWSIGVLIRELGALYAGTPLPPVSVRYADYATWQREHMSGAVLDKLLGYWRVQLAGLEPVLELPSDRTRPPAQSFQGALLPIELPRGLVERLRRNDVTLFMSLLAAFCVVLGRWSGRSDVVIGSPVAGRSRVEVEDMIGFFVNTLVLRVDLSGDPTTAELLARVRDTALDAHRFSELPFERLVEELAPARSLAHGPLVQVMFVLQNAPTQAWSLPGLDITPVPADTRTSKFDLTLSLTETDHGLEGVIEYSTDLFDASTMKRFAEHFRSVLDGLAGDPERRVSSIELREGSGYVCGAEAAIPPACVHDLFAEQVDRAPDAIAVRCGDAAITYRELDARANGLARRLTERGVGPEVVVGIRVERTIEMLVALLAVWKAGGAYLPLDPAYPRDRLDFMAADSGAAFVLTEVDGESTVERLGRRASPSNAAAVIYTSGSTGRPKGVCIEHQSLVNVAVQQRAAFGVGIGNEVLQLSSPSFDAATFEIMLALLNGACLVVGDPDALIAQVRERSIVVTPPSVFDRIHDLLPDGTSVISAGERCRPEHVAAWQGRGPFYNAYGPTEASIWSTLFSCATARDPVPIGRPVGNVRACLLDEFLQPVPDGAVGELYIGGAGVARGYLGQPALTAERFVPDPLGRGRLYRTGDRVRQHPDGELEFLGRSDGQIKVRGYRVELGEVEAALEGAVVAVRDGRLVAYARQPVDLGRARAVLPNYMIPAEVIIVDEWPSTANGKLDLMALPAPSGSDQAEFLAPATPTECTLTGIWQEVLAVERVGLNDDFFALGGDSITAIHAAARALRPA